MAVEYPFKKYEDSHRELYDELFDTTINIFTTTVLHSECTPAQGENYDSTLEFIDKICAEAKEKVKNIKTNGERPTLIIKVYHAVNTPDRKFIDE